MWQLAITSAKIKLLTKEFDPGGWQILLSHFAVSLCNLWPLASVCQKRTDSSTIDSELSVPIPPPAVAVFSRLCSDPILGLHFPQPHNIRSNAHAQSFIPPWTAVGENGSVHARTAGKTFNDFDIYPFLWNTLYLFFMAQNAHKEIHFLWEQEVTECVRPIHTRRCSWMTANELAFTRVILLKKKAIGSVMDFRC